MDPATKETKQLTHFTDFDIKFPSIGKQSIVFEQAGYIWRYDLATGQASPVSIDIKEDFDSGRGGLVDAAKHLESVNLAPDGERTIVVARGDLFSVPAKNGTPRNLSKTSGAHEREAIWSPDGKWIAYNSDATGENEVAVRAQEGKGEPQQIANGAATYDAARDCARQRGFSDKGKNLLLSSAREFKPTFGDEEFANVYRDMERVYLVTLAKETANPLAPKSDEVGKAEEKRKKQKEKEGEEKKPEETPGAKKPEEQPKKPVVVKVDTDGIQNRILGLETTPGNYRNIRMLDDNRIFYLRRTGADEVGEEEEELFGEKDKKSHLCAYNVDDRKENVLGEANNYQITFD